MSRRILEDQELKLMDRDLVTHLADELKSHRETGQPMVYEQKFDRERIRVTVIWDAWERLSLEDRTSVILEAYAQAEGRESRSRIVLASGLTIPEAESAGMLPFQIFAALRKGDPVTLDQCREAMINVGASTLFNAEQPQLRFATREEAEAVIKELVKQLPGSEPVWVIAQDVGKVDDWLER